MSCDSGEAIRMLRDSDSWVYLRVQGGVGRGTGKKGGWVGISRTRTLQVPSNRAKGSQMKGRPSIYPLLDPN